MAARKKQQQRSRRAAPAKAAEVEVVEEVSGGIGIDDGIILTTSILLLGAIAIVYFCGISPYAA